MFRQIQIKDTSDKKFIDTIIESDLISLSFPSGEIVEITGRFHLGNGTWKLWNKTYTLEVQEVKTDESIIS